MVPDLPAQQMPPGGSASTSGMPGTVPPTSLARGARYLLRNGWDYITYQEYERSLAFFREAEARKFELNKDELQSLYQGIAKAQAGMREASNTTPSYAKSGKRRPGALALAAPASTQAPAKVLRQPPALPPPPEPEPIQLASNSASMTQPRGPASASAIPTTLPPQVPAGAAVQGQGPDLGRGPGTSPSPALANPPEPAMA